MRTLSIVCTMYPTVYSTSCPCYAAAECYTSCVSASCHLQSFYSELCFLFGLIGFCYVLDHLYFCLQEYNRICQLNCALSQFFFFWVGELLGCSVDSVPVFRMGNYSSKQGLNWVLQSLTFCIVYYNVILQVVCLIF